jgi:hypothetical protein
MVSVPLTPDGCYRSGVVTSGQQVCDERGERDGGEEQVVVERRHARCSSAF